MLVGVPKEVKTHEYSGRAWCRALCANSSTTAIRSWSKPTPAPASALATTTTARSAPKLRVRRTRCLATADMIVKVKEPQPAEYGRLRENQVLFTYLHLAPDEAQTKGLMESGCVAIAYETVTDTIRGGLPLLAPMSEVAGRMSVQVGAHCLEKEQGGSGMLLGGVPGVAAARVVIIGGGVSGTNAARMAMGMEAT